MTLLQGYALLRGDRVKTAFGVEGEVGNVTKSGATVKFDREPAARFVGFDVIEPVWEES